jgi:DNA topoisomerase-1
LAAIPRGDAILAGIGRFGPYLKVGTKFASLGADDDVLNSGLNRAVTVWAEAKTGGQLIRELGEHPEGGSVGLYRGRYGPYVSHGGLIASLPKGGDPDQFTLAEALPLLAAQKAKGKPARTPRRAAAASAPASGAAKERSAPTARKAKARGAAKSGTAATKTAKKPAAKRAAATSRRSASSGPAKS